MLAADDANPFPLAISLSRRPIVAGQVVRPRVDEVGQLGLAAATVMPLAVARAVTADRLQDFSHGPQRGTLRLLVVASAQVIKAMHDAFSGREDTSLIPTARLSPIISTLP